MAIKFNSLTFDLKDLLLICGFVAGYFNFKSEQNEKFNELKLEIKQIIADNRVQETKFNAKFDMLNKHTSERKTSENDTICFVAIVHDNRIKIESLDDDEKV
jgi:hypothetical protein